MTTDKKIFGYEVVTFFHDEDRNPIVVEVSSEANARKTFAEACASADAHEVEKIALLADTEDGYEDVLVRDF